MPTTPDTTGPAADPHDEEPKPGRIARWLDNQDKDPEPNSSLPILKPGTRKWFWAMRIVHLGLWFIPLISAIKTIGAFYKPHVLVRLDGREASAVNVTIDSTGHGVTATYVNAKVHHPAIYERLLMATPGLLLTLAIVCVCYSLWRVEINMAARVKPFTVKDRRWLTATPFIVIITLVLWFVAECGAALYATEVWGASAADLFDQSDIIVAIVMMVMLGTLNNVYHQGRKAYESLQEVV